ncbi:MAG: hypothetical protein SCALA702_00710 [Melioribacteraceae bacterium]|nr:MAG: hypothetical protein SCALA702_00710 [Melioribacteraceae bacterium]
MGFIIGILSVVSALTPDLLDKLVNLVTTVLEKLGIIDAKDSHKEMGDKMLQAEEQGITPENYENYDDYYKAIREFELDPEKSGIYSEKEKLEKYSAVGLAQIQEALGDGAISFLTEVATKLSPEFKLDSKVHSYLSSFEGNIEKLNGYFDGSLAHHLFADVEKQILDVEKKHSPEKSNDEILTALDKEREHIKEH